MVKRELILQPKASNINAYILFASFLAELFAVFFFLQLFRASPRAPVPLWLPFGLALLGIVCLVAVYELTGPTQTPPLAMDDQSIFDPRLGLGRIYWSDVCDVYTELSYRHRSICLKVKSPEKYIAKLSPKQRAKAIVQHELGFNRFTIDLRPYPVDPIQLRAKILGLIESEKALKFQTFHSVPYAT